MHFEKCFHPYGDCPKRALDKHFKTHLMLQTSGISPLRILGLCALFLFSACQQQSEASFAKRSPAAPPQGVYGSAISEAGAPEASIQDAALNGELFSSAAAIPSGIDSLKKFVRDAEIKFSVNNTADATLRIEDIALRHGGFVINSTLNSAVELRQTTPMNRDSALETTRYTLQSQIVLRVPYRQLDTTLRSIGKLSVFLDNRRVSAEDVGLQMFEKELARLREGIYRSDLSGSEENKNSPKADRARASREASDQARIETLKLEDAIRFSTVTVDVYQQPQISQRMVANTDVALPKQPFASRIGEAMEAGGEIVAALFLGIIHLWGVILLALLGYFSWKWLSKKKVLEIADAEKSS
jgi:hypothetical protein